MRDIILCLIGESGSGKTTIAKEMFDNGFNVIQSYTTRIPRSNNEWGHTFITKEELIKQKQIKYNPNICDLDSAISFSLQLDDNVVAYTLYKDNYYWTTKDQYKNKGITFYVVDQQGYEALKTKINDAEIISIYLQASKETRFNRMLDRYHEDNESNLEFNHASSQTGIDQAKERIEYDICHFYNMQYDYVIDANKDIKYVLAEINNIITKMSERSA